MTATAINNKFLVRASQIQSIQTIGSPFSQSTCGDETGDNFCADKVSDINLSEGNPSSFGSSAPILSACLSNQKSSDNE